MRETIDGKQTLPDQESAIQFKEALGFELTAFAADETNPPLNNTDFNRLPIGQQPKPIHLTKGPLPPGETEVWSGRIFMEGKLADARAFRK